jgi:hypothetical protein
VSRARVRPGPLVALSVCAALALASVSVAATSTSTSTDGAQPTGCGPEGSAAAKHPSAPGQDASTAGQTAQTLAVLVEPVNCPAPVESPKNAEPTSVESPRNAEVTTNEAASHGERRGRLVALTLRLDAGQETTCEIVMRYYSHRSHPVYTRTRYCRSKTHRGHWQFAGPVQHLPRWPILTGDARVMRVQVMLRVLSPTTQPIAHATVYLSDGPVGQHPMLKLTTNKQGVASALVPYGPKRALKATYPSESDYGEAFSQVEIQFQARTSYFASTRIIRSGEHVTFRGALQGWPLPKGATSAAKILVQYRRAHRWVTWGRTQTQGARWHITLALRGNPHAVTTRAVVLPSSGYPYIEGSSRIVHLYLVH